MLSSACNKNPYYSGPVSHNFDGTRFFNPGRPQTNTFGTFLRWQLGFMAPPNQPNPPRAEWPTHIAPQGPFNGYAKPAATVSGSQLVVTAVGHATFLIQTQNLNLLTDPVWENRASPVSWAGPQRITPPAIQWENLPKIHVIFISHNHYDHLCLPTLQKLVARDNPLIITPLGNDTIIKASIPNANVVAKDWYQTIPLPHQTRLTLEPMQHWSARAPWDRRMALWAAMMLETPSGAVYFVGDSGYGMGQYAGQWFADVKQKYQSTPGGIRLAILPIGAYEPRWFMQYSHMNPAEAVMAFQKTGAAYAIGHHFGIFQLTNESQPQPEADLATALTQAQISPQTFQALKPGQSWNIPLK